MKKSEFNKIKKRILAQVYPMVRDYIEYDLMVLWSEIKKGVRKK